MVFKDRAAVTSGGFTSTPFNLGGASSISKRFRCQATVVAFAFSLRLPFREGRGFYHRRVLCQLPSPTLSSPLFFGSAPLRFTASRGRGFYHHRVLCQPSFVDRLFRLSDLLRVIVAAAIVTVSKTCRGPYCAAAWGSTCCVDRFLPADLSDADAPGFVGRGAACTTVAPGVNGLRWPRVVPTG